MGRQPVSIAIVTLLCWALTAVEVGAADAATAASRLEYKVLATGRTSTMEKEMVEAAAEGYRFAAMMGGETMGGSEVVVVMSRTPGGEPEGDARAAYKLLATSRTSTMQKELSEAAELGYVYRGQSVFKTAFGGDEVVVILEKPPGPATRRIEYKLLATKRTSTMEKELREAAAEGWTLAGLTVSKTKMAGNEIVSILHREAR